MGDLVYVMHSTRTQDCKIGISRFPVHRVRQVRAYRRDDSIYLYAAFETEACLSVESLAHQYFSERPGKVHHGEWFAVSPVEAAAVVCNITRTWKQRWIDRHGKELIDRLRAGGMDLAVARFWIQEFLSGELGV